MEKFTAEQFTEFLDRIEKLKSVPRHCVTADGVQENVAGHSWRVAMMAYLMKDELGQINIDKVIRMCLIHDLGEAVTGDIPTFEKTKEHEAAEKEALDGLLHQLPDPLYLELTALFVEMEAQETKEAKVYKALDKLEAVIQHNESDISTWLDLEYELQQTYAAKNVEGFPFLEGLQAVAVHRTQEKIAANAAGKSEGTDDGSETETAEKSAADVPGRKSKAAEKARLKQEQREKKQQVRQDKKNQRIVVRQERKKELNLLMHIVALVMLAAFVVLAIDQVGVYGFLGVWLFIALMAASVAVLLVGIWCSARGKRNGILIGVAVTGILLCAVWFIFLLATGGIGISPIRN